MAAHNDEGEPHADVKTGFPETRLQLLVVRADTCLFARLFGCIGGGEKNACVSF